MCRGRQQRAHTHGTTVDQHFTDVLREACEVPYDRVRAGTLHWEEIAEVRSTAGGVAQLVCQGLSLYGPEGSCRCGSQARLSFVDNRLAAVETFTPIST